MKDELITLMQSVIEMESAAERSEALQLAIDSISAVFAENETVNAENEKLLSENTKLLDENRRLFLQKTEEVKDVKTEDEKPELSYDDLFDEKGELK